MAYMFDNCNKLTSLDLSNFNTSKLTSTQRLTNRWWTRNHSVGMLYCDKDTINKLIPLLKGNGKPTIYVKDVKPNELTPVEGMEFKEYKENSVMINLSSPLLKGDRIEVVDGKLCHYHKMGKVVLDGSDDEEWINQIFETSINSRDNVFSYKTKNTILDKLPKGGWESVECMCDVIKPTTIMVNIYYRIQPNFLAIMLSSIMINSGENGCIIISSNISNVLNFKQWLSENPITVVYELAEPYYEDITPLQSDIVLETYLECNMDIYTKLPIKANVSYITNVPSLSTLSMRATEMKESDNILANLTNMLDNEINE
jgi:surface protein